MTHLLAACYARGRFRPPPRSPLPSETSQISTPLPPSTLSTPHLRLLYPVRVFPSLPSTTILHTDDTFVVVDKPTGVPSQPYAGNCKDTLSRFVKDELGLEEEVRTSESARASRGNGQPESNLTQQMQPNKCNSSSKSNPNHKNTTRLQRFRAQH